MKFKLVFQVYKFILVGAFNTAIDLVVLNLLIYITDKGSSGGFYSLFKSISFLIALTNSYLLNKYWTFSGSAKKNNNLEILQFLFISLIGFIINVVVASVFVGHFKTGSIELQKFIPSIGALCGTAVGLIWNFFGYKYFVFKKHSELLPPV